MLNLIRRSQLIGFLILRSHPRDTDCCTFAFLDDEIRVNRTAKIPMILTVIVMLSAWFATSNHCALGLAVGSRGFQSVSEHPANATQCPFHTKSAAPKKPKPASDVTCCKILRATATSPAKNFTPASFHLATGNLLFTRFVVFAPPKIVFSCATLDTGPPAVISFAELILQRSVLAHAPPRFW